MSLSEEIYSLIFSLIAIIAIIRWGNLAWCHPKIFRMTMTLFVDPGERFPQVLWVYRLLLLDFGLLILFIFLIMYLSLVGILK